MTHGDRWSRPGPGVVCSGLLAAVVAFALVAAPLAAQPGGPLPGPLPLFPADNWWNVNVGAAPLDPQGGAFLDFIGRGDGLHPDFGGDADDFPEIYGMVYVSVPGSQPLVPVTFVEFGDESDAGAPGRPAGYPIPPQAKTTPKWIEGGYPGNAEPGGDRHMLIVDRDNRILYELYHTQWNEDLGRWEAGSGAVWPLDENRRRPETWTSADAAGLAILPGLVRYDEVFGPDPIRHAFRFTVRATNGHVYPASHTAGSTNGAPPLGLRLRLKSSKDISGYPPEVRKIFQAMKTYGLILADNGSDMYVQGAHDTRWDNDVLNPAFRSLKAGDFEVIQRGWQPSTPPPPACTPSDVRHCLNNGRFQVDLHWIPPGGTVHTARATELTADTGLFWFSDPDNIEVIVKVLNGCALNNRYWVFAAGLTNVMTILEVTDTSNGQQRRYVNNQGTAFRPLQDTGSFGGCP